MDNISNKNALGDEPRASELKAMSTGFGIDDAVTLRSSKPSIADAELLSAAGYELVLLGVQSKIPCELDWNSKPADNAAVIAAAKAHGNNIGVRMRKVDLVIDVDPRNGGDDSFVRLVADLDLDLSKCPHVPTGGGGSHYYLRKPEGTSAVAKLNAYPGIDFKSVGYVVAPGSIHPNGNRYESSFYAYGPDLAPDAPFALLSLLERKVREKGTANRAGELTPTALGANLALLDPNEFADYSDWMNMLMACHHATNGEGVDEFTAWSTQGDGYADASDVIAYKWNGLSIDQGGVTVQYLYKQLHDRGLTPIDRSEAKDDFEVWDQPKPKNTRWPFITIEELQAMPPPRWLVQGILLEDSIAAIFGAPESFKSFLAVDWAMSIAANRPWHDRTVLPGGVLYIAAEGARGLAKRVRAWKIENAFEGELSFHLMRNELNLTQPDDARAFAQLVVEELNPLSLIVIDTLNQTATGADENSAQDMGRYIASMKMLRDMTGASIVVVHHSGKDRDKGPRGSSALPGGFDTIIEVVRPDPAGMGINVKIYKQKDEEKDPPMRFVLEKVADSLVLRSSMMADAASDCDGLIDPVQELARELAAERGGRMPLKLLVDALRKRNGKSDKTVRRQIEKSIPEGRLRAVQSADSTLLWRERMDSNPKGEIEVRVEVVSAQ
jgi:hypothetical protein